MGEDGGGCDLSRLMARLERGEKVGRRATLRTPAGDGEGVDDPEAPEDSWKWIEVEDRLLGRRRHGFVAMNLEVDHGQLKARWKLAKRDRDCAPSPTSWPVTSRLTTPSESKLRYHQISCCHHGR